VTAWCLIWPVTEDPAAVASGRGFARLVRFQVALLAGLTVRLTGEVASRILLNADLDRTV